MRNFNKILKYGMYISSFIAVALSSCMHNAFEPPQPHMLSDLVINEIVSLNSSSKYDENGKDYDWIELYNNCSQSINLKNYALSDDISDPVKWVFGDYTLDSGEYCLVFASGNDITTPMDAPAQLDCGMQYAYPWADNSLGGESCVRPYEFNNILGLYNNKRAVSAVFYLSDNANSDELDWQEAEITVTFASGIDFTPFNMMVIRGYVDKDKELIIRMTQTCNSGFLGWKHIITGTGEDMSDYVIPLNQADSMIDLSCLDGFIINPIAINDSTHLTFKEVIFRHDGYYLHTNFKLSSKGEELLLTNISTDETADSVSIPELSPDVSYGRNINDKCRWSFYTIPTPGKENSVRDYNAITDDVQIVTTGGFYNSTVSVSMKGPEGTTVYYTVNGAVPTKKSQKYTSPVQITQTTCIRSIAYKKNEIIGNIKTETFFINETTTLPIISISVDKKSMFDSDTGMYELGPGAGTVFPYHGANFWDREREISAQIELFMPNRSQAFKEDFGLKIHGNWSRGGKKKSFAVMFRDKYGKSEIDFPLFPDYPQLTRFKSFVLRNGGYFDVSGLIKDCWNTSLLRGRDIDYQKYRSVILFINGIYWGIYNIREKLNKNYFKNNYDIDGYDVDLIKDFGIIQSGTSENYSGMISYLKANTMEDITNYQYIKTQMNVYNFMDYIGSEIFFANTDWPANNIKFWRQRSINGRWRWILYDTGGMGDDHTTKMIEFATNDSGDEWPNGPNSTFLFRTLLKNSSFKVDFINRLATLLNTNFIAENALIKLNEIVNTIKPEISRNVQRWNIQEGKWQNIINALRLFAEKRPDFLRENINDFFKLDGQVSLTLNSNQGKILINNMDVGPTPFTGVYFKGNPVTLEIVDAPGFKQWSDGNTESVRTVDLLEDLSLSVEFN